MGQHSEAELNQKFLETAKLMNIYLNHFPKFEKYALAQQIRQCMYEVYALIVEGQKRYHKVKAFIATLGLELSKYTIATVRRGVNFVGYRTWASRRFIRKHSLFKFSKLAKAAKQDSIASILGHARRTHSLQHLISKLWSDYHELYRSLPEVYRRRSYC